MADTKISALTDINGATASGDRIPIVDVSDTTQAASGTTKYVTANNLKSFVNPMTVVSLGSNAAANATTTAAKITGLDVASLAAGTYVATYHVRFQSSITTTGVRFSVNFTGTTSTFVGHVRYTSAATAASNGSQSQATAGAAAAIHESYGFRAKSTAAGIGTASTDAANSDMYTVIEVLFIATGSGTLELYHASETAASTTVMAGSSLILVKVA